MSDLRLSRVVFDEIEHTYTLKKKVIVGHVNDMPVMELQTVQLSGVTSLLHRQLFESKYDGIPKEVMAQAAERGNAIHRQIEMFESFGGDNFDEEVSEYSRLKSKGKYTTVATEWLVSDNNHVASSIDVIFEKGKSLYLCDIKTTSRLDMEYLSWQLSIYKYLLLLDNPDVKVKGLVACWLPKKIYGKAKMVAVPEKPMEWVKELIECDARGEKWVNPDTPSVQEQSLVIPQELTKAVADFLRAEKQAKEMKERLRELMEENGVAKWENEDFVALLGKASTQERFDTERFKKDNPDLYEGYIKTINVKPRFTIKLK